MILAHNVAEVLDCWVRDYAGKSFEKEINDGASALPDTRIYDQSHHGPSKSNVTIDPERAALLFSCQRALDIYVCAGYDHLPMTDLSNMRRCQKELYADIDEVEREARAPKDCIARIGQRWLRISQRVYERRTAIAAGEAPSENVRLLNELVAGLARHIWFHEQAEPVMRELPGSARSLLESIVELKHAPCRIAFHTCVAKGNLNSGTLRSNRPA